MQIYKISTGLFLFRVRYVNVTVGKLFIRNGDFPDGIHYVYKPFYLS